MVTLTEIEASNARLTNHGPGLVGIFVGGNGGIGGAALKAFIAHTEAPRVYLLARNETTATTILDEARTINPQMTGTFLKVDASLLHDIKRVCTLITSKESYINTIIFTCGGFSMTGRQETSEGLDRKLTLNFYARLYMTSLLLPLLAAGATKQNLASVVSILGAGREDTVLESDLELKQPGNYGIKSQFAHSIVFTDLLMEVLARKWPMVTFVHQFPGYVPTRQVEGLGLEGWWTPLRWVARGVEWLASPLAISLEESGERCVFSATSGRYRPREGRGDGESKPWAVGSDGIEGSGCYLLDWKGEQGGKWDVLERYREKGFDRTVEEHFNEVVKRVVK